MVVLIQELDGLIRWAGLEVTHPVSKPGFLQKCT
jgi:hypothetical protein